MTRMPSRVRARLVGTRPLFFLVPVATVLALVAGCATTGDDAVAKNGTGDFTFVSPGGQTRLFYAPNQRGRVSGLTGENLLQPGKQVSLADFPNQVVVINLWGSWCGPCRAEADGLQDVQSKTAAQGVTLLGIDERDSRQAATDFHQDRRLTYPSIYDPSGRTLLALQNYPRSTIPSTIVLDRQHRVAAIYLTEVLESDLLPEVQKVAAEPNTP
jgi:thiol-disulfide isomerase/thioredoxin